MTRSNDTAHGDSRTRQEAFLAIEHAGWQSLCASRGSTFYGALMAPDGVFIVAEGMMMTRDEVVDSLDGAPAWDTYEITDARVVPAGGEASALVYRATATRPDLEEPFTAWMSSLYRPIDGRPRLALYQQTRIGQ